MNRNRFVLVFDYETDAKYKESAQITEIAAVPIDLRNLEIISDEAFEMIVCPPDIDQSDYMDVHESTINFHAQQRNVSPQEIVDGWRKGVQEKEAWLAFCEYVSGYATSKSWSDLPMAAGQNIRGFDLPISDRYAKKYKRRLAFNKRDPIDLMDMTRLWFMFHPTLPDSLSMDALRDLFGLDSYGAHTAIKDVEDTASIIVKFLTLHETLAPKIQWNAQKDSEKV